MKRNLMPAIKSWFAIMMLVAMQVKALAVETGAENTDTGNFFSQPWIWIAIIVVTIMIFAGPFDYKKDFKVTMKKKNFVKRNSPNSIVKD